MCYEDAQTCEKELRYKAEEPLVVQTGFCKCLSNPDGRLVSKVPSKNSASSFNIVLRKSSQGSPSNGLYGEVMNEVR